MASVHQPSSNPKRRSMSINASERYIGNHGVTAPERGRRSKGREGCVPAHARLGRSTTGAVVVPVLFCTVNTHRPPERQCLPGEPFFLAARPLDSQLNHRRMNGSSGSIEAGFIIRTSPHPHRRPRNVPTRPRTKPQARHPLPGYGDRVDCSPAMTREAAAKCVPLNKVTCASKLELEQEWRS